MNVKPIKIEIKNLRRTEKNIRLKFSIKIEFEKSAKIRKVPPKVAELECGCPLAGGRAATGGRCGEPSQRRSLRH